MSYETPSEPRFDTNSPVPPSLAPRPSEPPKTTPGPDPAWRTGKCLACLGKGTRTVYRSARNGTYLPLTIRCEQCEGTGGSSSLPHGRPGGS